MYIKQKLSILLVFSVIALLFQGVMLSSTVDAAPTAAEKAAWQQCKEDWDEEKYYSDEASQKKLDKYNNSDCSDQNGGNCGTQLKGTGSFKYIEVDCPISDKYVVENDKREACRDKGKSYDRDTGKCGDDLVSTGGGTGPDDACDTATTIIKVECGSGNGVEDNAIWALLLLVITIMTAGIGLLAVGGLVYGAILYTTAQNNSGQITKAKETIANVIIGLVLYAFMWSLLQFLVPGGVFE